MTVIELMTVYALENDTFAIQMHYFVDHFKFAEANMLRYHFNKLVLQIVYRYK
ncbi:hypothetical protein D3C78_1663120 [compost metagenome]